MKHVDEKRRGHYHANDMTAAGVAGWMGCTRCQNGHPVRLSSAAAHAIASLLAQLQEGGDR